MPTPFLIWQSSITGLFVYRDMCFGLTEKFECKKFEGLEYVHVASMFINFSYFIIKSFIENL